ncbi:head-tail connector protein [Jeongeupia sp. USM3]|uniref:head-tail connector protein n=1 Tax=Jeongeupia sp. USM3 TaxID=1906741 RepID=UPI00089DFAD6|nr:head-tail connector protein [Jeongeupia sp. USM3]AOY00106.1 hypothetical protein BJP62_06360 [Jeongeupia sp. USM3]
MAGLVPMARVKAHLRLDPDETFEDDLVSAYLAAASEFVANETRRALYATSELLAADASPPANALVVTASLQAAILLMVGHLYENREAVNVGNLVTEMPFAVRALLGPYLDYTRSP